MAPNIPISIDTHKLKYQQNGEGFEGCMERISRTLADDADHHKKFFNILMDQRFLPAGRVQSAVGGTRHVTAVNCFVSRNIEDSYEGIMQSAVEAGRTMRLGGGIGFNFGTIRPRGDIIKSLDSQASGPISFMDIHDAVCRTICSAGHRRGAMMGTLPVSHPDILEFIRAKRNQHKLTGFNLSVLLSDKFMRAVENDGLFNLEFSGRIYNTIRAGGLYDEIMESTWDWAEPGAIFLDRSIDMNTLYYDGASTPTCVNPCSEQILPPFGACLLGSFNLVKYVKLGSDWYFDIGTFTDDIFVVVNAMDNVIENTIYPLPEQEIRHKSDRRMGLGITGLANALERLGMQYGMPQMVRFTEGLVQHMANIAYIASSYRARDKGSFPLFDKEKYLAGNFVKTLSPGTLRSVENHGMRNSHLISVAPTGTISLCADNISSGIEPPFSLEFERTLITFDGPQKEKVSDYAWREWGIKGRTALECSMDEHLNVLLAVQKWTDSAVSKTVNVGDHVTFDQFKNLYMKAWKGGAKGLSTYRNGGKRAGILNVLPTKEERASTIFHNNGFDNPLACTIDEQGRKTCE